QQDHASARRLFPPDHQEDAVRRRLSAFALALALGGGPAAYAGGRVFVGPDIDGDGMPDLWESSHGLDPANPADAALDPDADGLVNLRELEAATDPFTPDTDGDGLNDGAEVASRLDPLDPADAAADQDGDGLSNRDEVQRGTDPKRDDTDGDGMPDGFEAGHGLDPRSAADARGDADGDG